MKIDTLHCPFCPDKSARLTIRVLLVLVSDCQTQVRQGTDWVRQESSQIKQIHLPSCRDCLTQPREQGVEETQVALSQPSNKTLKNFPIKKQQKTFQQPVKKFQQPTVLNSLSVNLFSTVRSIRVSRISLQRSTTSPMLTCVIQFQLNSARIKGKKEPQPPSD